MTAINYGADTLNPSDLLKRLDLMCQLDSLYRTF